MSREPRPSTDDATAPLLRDPEANDSGSTEETSNNRSFNDHLANLTQAPLTPLTKLLLVLTLVLLLLTSVFIGLFAGVKHKLNEERERHPHETATVTATTTIATATHTTTTTIHGEPSNTTPGTPPPTGSPNNVCTTPNCVILAASILEGLDESQDPCNNFYEFTNGGWFDKHEIPPGRGLFGTFNEVNDNNLRIIRKLLESPSEVPEVQRLGLTDEFDTKTLGKLRDLYSSCVNEDLLDERGDEPLRRMVKVVKGLYSGNSTSISSSFDSQSQNPLTSAVKIDTGLTAAVAFLHSRGIPGLFEFDIEGDVGKDPNDMQLWFSQPDLGLPAKQYYLEKDITDLYEKTLARILVALDDSEDSAQTESASESKSSAIHFWPPWPWPPWGDDENNEDKPNKTARAESLAKGVVQFESKLANASLDPEVLGQDPFGTYNPISFLEFSDSIPQIHIPTYLASFATRHFPGYVIVTSKTYGPDLSSILDETPSDFVEAYLVTRVALSQAATLGHSTEVWQANRALEETLQGIKKGQVPDRSEWCIQNVEGSMGFAVGRFFVQETFTKNARERATKVITDTITAFKESLNNLSWMDEQSAKAATEKADAIGVKVGYPDYPYTEDSRAIWSWYNGVKINESNFFENIISAQMDEVVKKWQALGRRRNPDSWEMPPSMVNAYFNPPANEIVFPAGILRPPFFSEDWPWYLSFGAFGQVAAHELTHAFDSAGRLYNQNGKLEEWWTNATSEGFTEIQNCIANQYSKYTVDDGKGGKAHVNGNLTSGENIGDSGYVQAYRAWKSQHVASLAKGEEPLLPGLKYNQEQLFFIAFGQIWAQLIKPQTALARIRTDPHSPNRYRVEGTLSNMPEFAKAFDCPEGSKLNPPRSEQCLLWT